MRYKYILIYPSFDMTDTGNTNISVVKRIAGTAMLTILFYFFKYEALSIKTISLK